MKKDKQSSVLPMLLLVVFVAAVAYAFGRSAAAQSGEGADVTAEAEGQFILPDMRVVESVLPLIPVAQSDRESDGADVPDSSQTPDNSQTPADEQTPADNPKVTINLRNDTSFDINVQQLLDMGVRVPLNTEGVQVIIVHTHGTEAYTQTGSDTYTESDELRTLDPDYNVLRVGEELKNALADHGIKAVHCTVLCDYPEYSGAYDRSYDAIAEMLRLYPEAQIVIDLHRDAVATADGGYYKATAEIEGKNAAQLLFVVGTDGGGLSHPDWRENMSFQLRLHERIEQLYPGLMRPINVRAARFNQHFRTGSMLLEVGTCANYLDEALYSARLFANALADVLKNG
ncbi:MAG: stage II sporulation protein P [Clostridia bacterium]|nr:stage II sporulation protein P [Clostridia bacterium]MBR4955554.1 stage II sporulation protein P [Clostridia bacterium]MBR5903567.1 stage II sporulation protein P [Clostridia bacterium]